MNDTQKITLSSSSFTAAEMNLLDFVLNEYQPGAFQTSWSNYSITPTREEELLDAVQAERHPEEDHTSDWVKDIPDLLIALAMKLDIGDDDDLQLAHERIATFLGDLVRDLSMCHMRENTNG